MKISKDLHFCLFVDSPGSMVIIGWEPVRISLDQDFSTTALLTLNNQIILCCAVLLCIVVYLVALLATTIDASSITHSPPIVTTKNFYRYCRCTLRGKITQHRTGQLWFLPFPFTSIGETYLPYFPGIFQIPLLPTSSAPELPSPLSETVTATF